MGLQLSMACSYEVPRSTEPIEDQPANHISEVSKPLQADCNGGTYVGFGDEPLLQLF